MKINFLKGSGNPSEVDVFRIQDGAVALGQMNVLQSASDRLQGFDDRSIRHVPMIKISLNTQIVHVDFVNDTLRFRH